MENIVQYTLRKHLINELWIYAGMTRNYSGHKWKDFAFKGEHMKEIDLGELEIKELDELLKLVIEKHYSK